jgi:vancomycin aglycone glucosyltransferase
MRVLLAAVGTRGDVQPLAALGQKLTEAGHQVRLCVPEAFRAWVEDRGFEMAPIGPQSWAGTIMPEPGTAPGRMREISEAVVANQFEAVAAAARDCDLIVAAAVLPAVVPAIRTVAEHLRIGYVFASFCPAFLPSPYQPPPRQAEADRLSPASNAELWDRQRQRINARLGAALNRQRELAGLGPVDDVTAHIVTDRPWVTADPVLAPWPGPADGSAVQTGAWVLADDRPLAPEIKEFLDAGEPPAFLGFGSMAIPAEVAPVLVKAAREAGCRAIISAGRAGLALAGNEPDCLVVGEVNQEKLFRRVAVVMHHGGAGTTTTAGFACAPQVVVPQRFDQPYWASRVSALGIGAVHAMGVPEVHSLAAALDQALAPAVAGRARSVGAAMERQGAAIAAALITRLRRS